MALAVLAVSFLLNGCGKPEKSYEGIRKEIEREDYDSALVHVDNALKKYQDRNDEWPWRFRILKARILISRNQYTETLKVLEKGLPGFLASTDIAEQRKLYQGIAHRNAQQFQQAQRDFEEAEVIATSLSAPYKYQLLVAKADLKVDESEYVNAEALYKEALALARNEKLPSYYEMSAIGNLGRLATSQEHFDEAVDINQSALRLARSLEMNAHVATILGNMGSSYFQLGNFVSALDFYKQGTKASQESGLAGNAAYWFTGVANSYMELHDYTSAEELSKKTLDSADTLHNAQTTVECLNILTEIALRTDRLEEAERYNQRALKLENEGADHFGISESSLLAGRIELEKRNFNESENLLKQVIQDSNAKSPVKWQAESALAELKDKKGLTAEADEGFRAAIDRIEAARSSIEHEELRVSFLSTGMEVYGDYIGFLIRHGRSAEALEQAELSRARTLAEGLTSAPQVSRLIVRDIHPQQQAKRMGGPLLFYWLGERQSYLWVITSSRTTYFNLPKLSEIEPIVKSYRKALQDLHDPRDEGSGDGKKLYSMLVEPARKVIPKGARVILLPDPSVAALNFETLIVPDPQPHFWIEDVTLTTASSLTLLAASAGRSTAKEKSLLLVGNTEPVDPFPPLLHAPKEMKSVENYFPQARRTVLEGKQATPSAYLNSNPERFAYLHFVTHGTASVTRPLESAVILSKEGDSYKLYARDIVKHPITAQLVTISACEGAGSTAYSGEGLIGLSWAFLRAGAHNVIGALWEVSDSAAPDLMDSFYSELSRGQDTASALRAAKLSLLHSKDTQSVFRKPYYWAPFQLYAGS